MVLATDIVPLLSVGVALAGLATTVYLWLRGRSLKRLTYQLSSTRVVSVREEAGDTISILYEGHAVGDVRLLTLRIKCAGNIPITADDFDRPLSVQLGEGAEVLRAEIAKSVPENLDPKYAVRGTVLEIAPLLLNPGDFFEATALVTDLSEAGSLDGRIKGVPRLTGTAAEEEVDRRAPIPRQQMMWAIAVTVVALLILGPPIVSSLGNALDRLRSPQSYARHTAYLNTRVQLQHGTLCATRVVTEEGHRVVVVLKNGHLQELNPHSIDGIEPYSC
jgi:hypothetical protein